jgi:hypothetical protein
MKIKTPMPTAKAQDRTNAAMAPPDPMTTGLTPEGLAQLVEDELEAAPPEAEPEKPEDGADPTPPNPHRPHTD